MYLSISNEEAVLTVIDIITYKGNNITWCQE